MRASSAIVFLAALLATSTAWPCNYCKEDNRSAVYSYEAMQKVKSQPDKLEFVVLKIKGKISSETADAIRTWLGRQAGVDTASVKISTLQKSLGFVFEKAQGLDALVGGLIAGFPPLQFEILHFDK